MRMCGQNIILQTSNELFMKRTKIACNLCVAFTWQQQWLCFIHIYTIPRYDFKVYVKSKDDCNFGNCMIASSTQPRKTPTHTHIHMSPQTWQPCKVLTLQFKMLKCFIIVNENDLDDRIFINIKITKKKALLLLLISRGPKVKER